MRSPTCGVAGWWAAIGWAHGWLICVQCCHSNLTSLPDKTVGPRHTELLVMLNLLRSWELVWLQFEFRLKVHFARHMSCVALEKVDGNFEVIYGKLSSDEHMTEQLKKKKSHQWKNISWCFVWFPLPALLLLFITAVPDVASTATFWWSCARTASFTLCRLVSKWSLILMLICLPFCNISELQIGFIIRWNVWKFRSIGWKRRNERLLAGKSSV